MNHAAAVPILMYHHVSPAAGLVTVTPEHFRAHVAWLAEHGWQTLTLDQIAAFLAGQPVRRKSVVITFDDGYLDNWTHAHPVLSEHGLNGVIFLITGQIGTGQSRPHAGQEGQAGERMPEQARSHSQCKAAVTAGHADEVMLRWSEIAAMRSAGTFEFHSHTHTHSRWDQHEPVPEKRHDKLAQDLMASRASLLTNLGHASPHLCWPQGYYDEDYLRVAHDCGFRYCYTTRPGTVVPVTDAQRIPRLVVKDKSSDWLAQRLAIYSRPQFARLYESFKNFGHSHA